LSAPCQDANDSEAANVKLRIYVTRESRRAVAGVWPVSVNTRRSIVTFVIQTVIRQNLTSSAHVLPTCTTHTHLRIRVTLGHLIRLRPVRQTNNFILREFGTRRIRVQMCVSVFMAFYLWLLDWFLSLTEFKPRSFCSRFFCSCPRFLNGCTYDRNRIQIFKLQRFTGPFVWNAKCVLEPTSISAKKASLYFLHYHQHLWRKDFTSTANNAASGWITGVMSSSVRITSDTVDRAVRRVVVGVAVQLVSERQTACHKQTYSIRFLSTSIRQFKYALLFSTCFYIMSSS